MVEAHESSKTGAEPGEVPQTASRILHTRTTRRVDELRPHPAYAQLGLKVPMYKLNALIEQGDDAFLASLTMGKRVSSVHV